MVFACTLAAMKKRLIVGITGATGAVYGVRMLEALKSAAGWESHAVLAEAGALNPWHELKMKRKDLARIADAAYHPKDIAATIASGSVPNEGPDVPSRTTGTLATV